jgi:hypothetical protein
MGKGLKNRFTAFIETDDNDDTSGGVMLRNFVNDSHNSNSSGVSTPIGSNSSPLLVTGIGRYRSAEESLDDVLQ